MAKGRLLNTKLNIQVFAGPTHLMLTEGEQARYMNTMLEALGGADAMPLQRFMQIDSSPNTENAIFYDFGKLVARERANITNDNQLGQNVTPITGTQVNSVSVSPKWLETPLYIDDREFDKSQLAEESAVTKAQVTAVYTGAEHQLCELFKECFKNKKRTVKNSKNKDRDIIIPAKNIFGDKTKKFDDPVNVKAFRLMMRTVQALAKRSKRDIAVVTGIEGGTELNNCDKFTSKDYNNFNGGQTPNQTGVNPDMLLGGSIEQLIEYDEIFYSKNDIDAGSTGVMTIFVGGSFGQKAKNINIKPTVAHITNLKQYFLDVEIAVGTEIVQGEGVFFFTYKRDTTIGAGVSECSEDGGTPANSRNAVEPSKEDKILKLLGKIDKDNEDIKATLDKHGITVNGPKVQVTLGDQEPVQGENPPVDEKTPKNKDKK
ncbi:MAG: hypothetical protein ACRDA4_08565 [Filifactoraceae bacterium]